MTIIGKQFNSRLIADKLDFACSRVAPAIAERIRLCNSDKNVFFGKDMFTNRNGTPATGIGGIWNCGSVFCHQCVARPARKNRPIAEYVFDNLPKHKRVFIVLTMPDNSFSHYSLDTQLEICQYAFRHLYRHSDYFKSVVKGAIKTVEFTINDLRKNPYHVHINLLADAGFISHLKLKQEWTKALEISVARFGIVWKCPTKNGLANVRLKQIVSHEVNPKNDHKQINDKKVVFELCKYVTKPQTWQHIPTAHLSDIAENEKVNRFFEVLGSCRRIAKAVRRYAPAVMARKALKLVFTVIEMHKAQGLQYVHTSCLIVLNALFNLANYSHAPPKKRKLSWFWRIKLGITTLTDYKKELDDLFYDAWKYRTKQLRELYPKATFQTLAGARF